MQETWKDRERRLAVEAKKSRAGVSGMAIPRKLEVSPETAPICRRLGVRFNGEDQGSRVRAYDLDAQTIKRRGDDGEYETLSGRVEVYWR